jgi:hypothetical protein
LSPIKLSLYCDESEPQSIGRENWLYYGLLLIPEENKMELLNRLINARCIPNNNWKYDRCEEPCGYHKKNNTEIHFSKLSRNHEFRISKKWIKILLNECKNDREKIIYLNILGLNKSRIDRNYWKRHNKKDIKIYGRFLFTAIKSIKYFFPNTNKIKISNIFHDNSPLKNDTSPYYDRLLNDLRSDKKIELVSNEMTFVDSDHRKSSSQESHFLQFIDLLLGLAVNYIHFTSKKKRKVELTRSISDLYSRLIHNADNKNSSFNYYRQKRIQSFPSDEDFYIIYKDLTGNVTEKRKDNLFYSERRCLFEEATRDKNQTSLKDFTNKL